MTHPSTRRGFTLLELVIVALVIAIAVGLLILTMWEAKLSAARTQTLDSLRQMAIAIHNCDDAYRKLPPAFDKFGLLKTPFSLHVHLLSWFESSPLYSRIVERGEPIDTVWMWYRAPSDWTVVDDGTGIQNFAANLRIFSDKGYETAYNAPLPELFRVEPSKNNLASVTDGRANTILFATKHAVCGNGGSRYAADPTSPFAAFFGEAPADRNAHASQLVPTYQLAPVGKECRVSPLMAQSFFEKRGLAVAMADASVRTVSPKVNAETWNRAVQPNDGLALGDDWDN
jgi:prepilin-type N-terminal cleavage/methylation domain-containing protein